MKYSVIFATLSQQRDLSHAPFTATKVKTKTAERRITKLDSSASGFYIVQKLQHLPHQTAWVAVHIFCVSPSMEQRPGPFAKFGFFQTLMPTQNPKEQKSIMYLELSRIIVHYKCFPNCWACLPTELLWLTGTETVNEIKRSEIKLVQRKCHPHSSHSSGISVSGSCRSQGP